MTTQAKTTIRATADHPAPANTDKVLEAHKVITSSAQHWSSHAQGQARRLGRHLAAFVLVPTLAAAFYLFVLAADQYETEMHISVRSAQGGGTSSMFGSLFSGMPGMSQSAQDVKNVADFIRSHNAVRALQEKVDLRGIYGHADADFLTRLSPDAPLEELAARYREGVDVVFDTETGTAVVRVRAYTPQDTLALAEAMLELSETAANSFNLRAEEDALQLAREEVARAEERYTKAGAQIVEFRLANKEIDPTMKSGSILGIIDKLEQEYSAAQAKLTEMSTYMTADNVEIKMAKRRLVALQEQIRQEQSRLTGQGDTFTQKLSRYETLLLERDMAQQAYASTLVSLENARMEAQRQKSYVVPIIKPHLPQDPGYPHRGRGVALVFVCSLLAFGIGRLLYAGVRDHVMH